MLATLRTRDFALLWSAGLVSVAGDFALFAALPLHAFVLTGSAVAAGGVFAAGVIPRILLGSLAGVFVDRWDRKRTMVGADLVQAAALLPLLLVQSADLLWLLFLVRAAGSTAALFFRPAENALLPKLVGEERLVTANALNALNNNLGRLVGPALGGVLYASAGLGGVVLVDAATFLAAAALIVLIRTDARPERVAAPARSGWAAAVGEWRDGLRLVGGDRGLRIVFLAYGLGFVAEGAFEAGFMPLVLQVLGGGPQAAGVLLSAQAIGGFVAGPAVATVAARASPRLLFGGALILLGVADFGLATASVWAPGAALAAAAAALVFAGFPVVAFEASGTGLLQRLTADAFRGRVFGALGALGGLGTLIGLAVAGPLIDAVGVVPVMAAGALMWSVGGAVALLFLPRGGEDGGPVGGGSGRSEDSFATLAGDAGGPNPRSHGDDRVPVDQKSAPVRAAQGAARPAHPGGRDQ